jgi:hypothetical protein
MIVTSRVRTLIVAVVSVVTICFSAVPARADTNTEDLNQELPDGVTVQVMTTDADVLAQRALTLRQSPALLRYLASQTDDVDAALIDIAMIVTDEGIQALIENTRGMKFVPDSSSNLGVKLVPENVIAMEDLGGAPSLAPQGIPTRAKGWAAAWAYFAANSMVCGAFTAAGGVPGIICNGVFFTLGMLPEFNEPCRK